MGTTAQISLSGKSLSSDQNIGIITRFRNDLRSELGITSEAPQGLGRVGEKGDAVNLATIIVTLATSGTLVSIVKLIESYVTRSNVLEFSFRFPDGRELKFSGKSFSEENLAMTMTKVISLTNQIQTPQQPS